ncbi:MAG: CBS domain-containing protein [Candidatus Promineifilaceae bacterium]
MNEMMLILTHENADFDAVASQLAAHKLYPEGIPLLSWRVNRNVLQYLNLYWDAFHFFRPYDWRRQRVNRILLVDTVTLPSVRGVRPDRVQVQVIDHHEMGDELDNSWIYHVETVGATTTLAVEMLQDAGLNLTVNEATLLLLGIHEDTGSLVYDTTTTRDVIAAAWLMEQGAQLSVLRRFLNIPLSDEQQQLYEKLQESAEWITIEGQTIAIATATAPDGFEDEISAVAHRFRDAMTPDGLLILVQLKYNHIQLVARSSTNHFDVSEIARALGGGGHSRAAAATIMDKSLTAVRDQVLNLLPDAVRPMAKVAQIMSYGVQTLPETAAVAEADELMRKFGHEGYPVVDPLSGDLVGLVTRRIVDRAVSHQLEDFEIRQVMKAGHVTVRPSDSVEIVQRLMIQEGWGQIPVIPDEGEGKPNELIGIVTRTDLINLLSDRGEQDQEPNLRDLMSDSLPDAMWDMVQVVSEVAHEMGMPLYFVGGLVRDLLLDKAATDIDMVVEGDAIALVRRLFNLYGGGIRSHAQFGTAKWLLSPEIWRNISSSTLSDNLPRAIDFVTARTEFYEMPSALPEVERGSIKLDLHRRDFTINTLAIRLDGLHLGELLDFYGGRRDLELGQVRVLHSLSFVDDATRILRAVRLEQRLHFQIETRTGELIAEALPMLNRVTGDRIRNELEMCLLEAEPVPIFKRLAEFGVLAQIHPALTWRKQTEEAFYRAGQVLDEPLWAQVSDMNVKAFIYFALLLLPLSKTVQQEVMKALRVRRSTGDDIISAGILLDELGSLTTAARPSQVYNVLRPYRTRVLMVVHIILGFESPSAGSIEQYQRKWRAIHTTLKGRDLIEMGMSPGPEIGSLLDKLMSARLDGEISDEAGERALVAQVMAES